MHRRALESLAERPVAQEPTVADITEALMATYEPRLSLAVISRVVCQTRRHLAERAHVEPLPSMIYRLASDRLRRIATVAPQNA